LTTTGGRFVELKPALLQAFDRLVADAMFVVACYCRGTLIETARGRQQKVEALKIGDKIRTAAGALRPIKWIWRRSYGGRFIMGRKDILPVCFKTGSLGAQAGELRPTQCHSAPPRCTRIEACSAIARNAFRFVRSHYMALQCRGGAR
jgi:hypothetical protein